MHRIALITNIIHPSGPTKQTNSCNRFQEEFFWNSFSFPGSEQFISYSTRDVFYIIAVQVSKDLHASQTTTEDFVISFENLIITHSNLFILPQRLLQPPSTHQSLLNTFPETHPLVDITWHVIYQWFFWVTAKQSILISRFFILDRTRLFRSRFLSAFFPTNCDIGAITVFLDENNSPESISNGFCSRYPETHSLKIVNRTVYSSYQVDWARLIQGSVLDT